ncbi:MAG: hypothetical protein AAGC81_20455 [Pseudomonadota bacterium]
MRLRPTRPRPDLQEAIESAKARVAEMTPEERQAMWDEQRKSFVRGMMPTGDPRFD